MRETLKKADLLILTILPEETDAVVAALSMDGRFKLETGTNLHGWQGIELQSHQGQLRVIVGSTANAGNDKMQAVATDGLTLFQPKILLVVGVAGGVPKGSDPMCAGDIVMGNAVWSIDRGAIDEQGLNARPQSQIAGWGVQAGMQYIANHMTWAKGLVNADRTPPRLITGGIAATNYLLKVQDHELFDAIAKRSGNTIRAVEMESWGAAISSQQYMASSQNSVLFGMVRGLSDIVLSKAALAALAATTAGAAADQKPSAGKANSDQRDDWKQRAANNAAVLVAAWIKHAWPYPSENRNPPPIATRHRGPTTSASLQPQPLGAQPIDSQIALSPDDDARIQQTRSKILACLAQNHFDGIPNLKFATDGLPKKISAAFPATPGPINRVAIAEACIDAVLAFARELADAAEALGAAAPALVAKRKEQLWMRLVNAMQQAILLCAHAQKLQNAQALIEPHAAEFGDLEAMSWLSVSVMLRPELGNHLSARFPKDEPEVLKDRNHVEFQNGVELGTITTGSLADAKNQSYKVAYRAIYPAAAAFPDVPTQQQIDDLQGMTRQRAKDGQHLMAVFSKSGGSVTQEFTSFLKNDLSVGTVTITATNGVFELPEGHWRASLVKLLDALQPLLPAK